MLPKYNYHGKVSMVNLKKLKEDRFIYLMFKYEVFTYAVLNSNGFMEGIPSVR